MSGDFCLQPQELAALGDAFGTRAYDLASAVTSFQQRTGAEQIHDGFGFLMESEEVTESYVELAAGMAVALGGLARHLDEVGQALRDNARNSDAADDALADLFKGGKR
ncbi:hypothetical protein [Streptomyces griseorubiginosus]|uniref:hypothetical protein n=1 Tax=Streptomyces griseorubiginosus TaxID=67304 RepID=UPI00331924A7